MTTKQAQEKVYDFLGWIFLGLVFLGLIDLIVSIVKFVSR